MRATTGGQAKRPRPVHVKALKQADRIVQKQREREKKLQAQIAKRQSYAGNVRAMPASKRAKPLTREEQLGLAVNVGLKRSGVEKHIQTSGIGGRFRTPSLLNRALRQASSDLLYAGPGAAITAKNVGVDVKEALPRTKGGPGFKRSRAAAVGIGKHVYQDVRHPRRNIGHLAFDFGAAAAGGGGTVARGAAATRALRAGEGAARAVTRKGYEGGSLLHAPEPGTVKLRVGGTTVEKPLSRNAAVRQAQKAQYKRKQARLNQRRGKIQPESKGFPARATEVLTAPEHTVGRRLRVERRLEQAHAKGDLNYVHRLGKKLSRDEHTALRVAAIEGEKASVKAVDRHIATHEAHIAAGEDKAAHLSIIRDLQAARRVFVKPSEKFKDALAATRALSAKGEQESIARGFLKPETADARRLAIAKAYGVKGKVIEKAPAPEQLVQQERYVEGLERQLREATGGPRQEADLRAKLEQARHTLKEYRAGRDPYSSGGVEQPPPGSFYFHAGLGKRKLGQLGRVYEPQPAETGMAPPQIGRYAPEMRRQFRGAGITKGRVPQNIPKAVTEQYQRRLVLHSAHDLYDHLQKASTATRESRYQIPLRDSTKISTELKKYLSTVEENLHASPDALRAMTRDQVERLKQELEAAQHHDAPLGANIKGVRWVDSRLIKDLGQTSLRGWFEKTADAVTNPIRFGTLYMRPAYALNLAGNAGMLAPEGASAISAVGRAVRMPRRVGERNTAWVDAQMGSGKALGQQVGTGFLSKSTHGVAEGWNKLTDLHARRAAFEIEAKRAGFRTKQDFDRLRTDPKLATKRREVTERARNIIGDYENLNPVEKNQIRRALYFYPWTKVATKWTGHTLAEHPIKTAAAVQVGRTEQQHAQKILGAVPAWVKQTGLLPIGHEHGGLQPVVNPSSINTPATVTQTGAAMANAARGLVGMKQHPGAGLSDLLTPAFESFVSAGGQSPMPGRHTGVLGAAESTPIPSALRRLGVYGKPSKTYPETGVGPGLGPLGAGGLYPRKADLAELHKQAEKELTATMGPAEHTAYKYHKFETQMKQAIKQKYGHAEIPPVVAERLNLWHERTAGRARVENTTRAHLASDFDILEKHGWITAEQASNAKLNLPDIPDNKLPGLTRYLTDHFFDRDKFLHGAVKHLGLKLP